jgi:hypothetical protein
MQRRQFIAGLASAAAWPLVARAQEDRRLRRIGVLGTGSADDVAGILSGLRAELRDRG